MHSRSPVQCNPSRRGPSLSLIHIYPFLAGQSAGPEQIENAIGTLYLTIAEAAKTFELLELKRFEPILANILYQGMKETVDSIVSKKEKTI